MSEIYTDKRTNIKFDDFIIDSTGTWSQVCKNHSKWFKDRLEECPINGLICGINGCSNKAVNYVNLEVK